MTEKVKSYLQAFFLAGDEDKTERMSANEMVRELKELVKEGEIQADEVPQVKTVENWISRTSATLRKQAAADRRRAEHCDDEISQGGACPGGINSDVKETRVRAKRKNNK
jgi:hypothetical protein